MNQMIDEYKKFIKIIELIKFNYMIYFNILKYNHFQLWSDIFNFNYNLTILNFKMIRNKLICILRILIIIHNTIIKIYIYT